MNGFFGQVFFKFKNEQLLGEARNKYHIWTQKGETTVEKLWKIMKQQNLKKICFQTLQQ